MEFTPFDARMGRDQGRLEASEGGHPERATFVLGSAQAGRLYELAPGDRVTILQPLDLTDLDFVRADLHLAVPESTPPGFAWEAALVVDEVVFASRRCRAGESRRLKDLAANVSKRRGVAQVGVRLRLRGE